MNVELRLPVRMRRLRKNVGIRRLFQETQLSVQSLVQPYFVIDGSTTKNEAQSRYGLFQVTSDVLVDELDPLVEGGLGGVMLFGVPELKSDHDSDLPRQLASTSTAIALLRKAYPTLPIFVDVCLCSYTTHGHCGRARGAEILNDESVQSLCKMAVELGAAGADYVCPSDMMDGRVAAIRAALDAAGLPQVGILSYAVKMASALYGPFRHAANSAPMFGDRTSYQQQPHNRREALRELALDVDEGADALLVKPALTNLDLIRDARERTALPLFAYQVSGEYAMLRAAADAGLIDFERAMLETLTSIRRAGADVIVSYAARAMALKR